MDFVKKHWMIILTGVAGWLWWRMADRKYGNYLNLRDAFMRANPGQGNPYKWDWLSGPFSY